MSVPETAKTQHYASALYARMDSESSQIEGDIIWQGRIIDTCISLGIPQGGYNRVVNALRKLGCIELIERGYRGNTPTVYRLLAPPTVEAWAASFVKSAPDDLTRKPSLDTLSKTVEAIADNIGGIHIPSALMVLDKELKKLQGEVRELRTQIKQIDTHKESD